MPQPANVGAPPLRPDPVYDAYPSLAEFRYWIETGRFFKPV